ncbi:MAG: oligosaccharide flippase family protein [Propionibacteriaceae bacterium]|jgi:O-antigen/teichoic acid export membrane protein|nr:oligosaccharide flippase family protein [Propionibacteriaceae bacterium]
MQRQYVVLLSARGIAGLTNTILLILVARASEVTAYGVLGMTIGIFTYASITADFGMSTFILRERARHHDANVVSSLRLNLLTSCLMGSVGSLICFILFLVGNLPWGIILLAVALSLEKNTDTTLAVSIADRRIWVSPASLLLRRFVGLGGLIALTHNTGLSSISSYCLATLAGAVLAQVHARVTLRNRINSTGASPWRQLVKDLWPFALATISSTIRNLDSAVVSIISGTYQGGLYAAAIRLIGPFGLISNSLGQVLVPNSAQRSRDQALGLSVKVVAFYGVLLALSCTAAVFATPIIVALMGREYQAAGSILATALATFPIIALSSPLGSILQGQNDDKFVATNGVTFGVLLLGVMPLGAKLGSGVGVVGVTGIVFLVKNVSLWLRLRKICKGS